jgi:hypothetical protein
MAIPATAIPPRMICRREGTVVSRLYAAFDFMLTSELFSTSKSADGELGHGRLRSRDSSTEAWDLCRNCLVRYLSGSRSR